MMTSTDCYITFSLLGSLYNNFPKLQNFQIREEGHSYLTWKKKGRGHQIIISIITSWHIRKMLLKPYKYLHVSSDPDTTMARISLTIQSWLCTFRQCNIIQG